MTTKAATAKQQKSNLFVPASAFNASAPVTNDYTNDD